MSKRLSTSNKPSQSQTQQPSSVLHNPFRNLFQQQQQQQQHINIDSQPQQPPSTQKRSSSLYKYVETPPTPVNIFTKRASIIPGQSSNNANNNSVSMSPVTPITKSSGTGTSSIVHSNYPGNVITTPGAPPTMVPGTGRKSVTVSAIKPRIHTYPSSPSPNLSNGAGSGTGGTNIGAGTSGGGSYPISPYSNSNNISTQLMDTSSFYYSPDDNNDSVMSEAPESFYIPEGSYRGNILDDSLLADSNKSTPAKLKSKSLKQRIQEIISYPVDKWDEIHEEALVLFNHPIYNTCIYSLCAILNAVLFGYSIELFGNLIGTILVVISILNSIFYFYSKKKVHLYRYQSNRFISPNMHIESIETPTGSVDNVVILEVWEPKFTSQTIFTFFSPLHVALMVSAGSDLNRFINSTILSILISLGIYYISIKYNGKIRDEKILFSQLCEEYNYQFKPKPYTKDVATQTFY